MESGNEKANLQKQQRKGPAPFASFEDVSDEASSPETKQQFQLPDIKEDLDKQHDINTIDVAESQMDNLSANTKQTVHSLQTPSTPRIDISRASSSSHHDSRDSSPDMALFSGKDKDTSKLELGFREEGALDLRSSTEELSFMEPNVATTEKEVPRPPSRKSPLMFKLDDRQPKHGRKDSQCSDIVLLSISGRTSRLSSIGSQGSGHSNISANSYHSNVTHMSTHSRLSVISGISRSPSPHKMLLETSFCGPKPIETEPEIVSESIHEKLLELASSPSEKNVHNKVQNTQYMGNESVTDIENKKCQSSIGKSKIKKEISNVVIVKEVGQTNTITKEDVQLKGNKTKEVKRKHSKTGREIHKNVIRIKLKPDHMYDDNGDDDDESDKTISNQDTVQKPVSLNLNDQHKKMPQHFSQLVRQGDDSLTVKTKSSTSEQKDSQVKKKILVPSVTNTPCVSPTPSRKMGKKDRGSRTPSPGGVNLSRKSSFCSLFKSRDATGSPDSPNSSQSKKKSNRDNSEGSRSRSKSKDRSLVATPNSGAKPRCSVLFLFKQPRKSSSALSPCSRDTSPVVSTSIVTPRSIIQPYPPQDVKSGETLKYYENTSDGIIHISLHTPPEGDKRSEEISHKIKNDELNIIKHTTENANKSQGEQSDPKSLKRTVLPDGSIIIPLHSPDDNSKITDDMDIIQTESSFKKNITTTPDIINETEYFEKKNHEPNITTMKSSTSSEDNPLVIVQTVSSVEPPPRKKESVIFTTNVGSREQVFSTQFSITKTPSITSEKSECFSLAQDSPSAKEKIYVCQKVEKSVQVSPILSTESLHRVHLSQEEMKTVSEDHSTIEKLNLIKDVKVTDASAITIDGSSTHSGNSSTNRERHKKHDEVQDSSESDLSSEIDLLKKHMISEQKSDSLEGEEIKEEKKNLVQQDSFEDELPYVPTTLPLERSVALPIKPVKERQSTGMKMYPIERPRSTTPIYPSCLDEYFSDEPKTPDTIKGEKIKISLPKEVNDRTKTQLRSKSPRRVSYSSSPKTWGEFAELGLPSTATKKNNNSGHIEVEKQPALPPRAPVPKTQWINFEEMPEKRKMPKRIQTIPMHNSEDREDGSMLYNYVNPEDCKCECHETKRNSTEKEEDEEPLLNENNELEEILNVNKVQLQSKGDRRSLVSESSLEFSYGHMDTTDVQSSTQIGHPFNMDLDVKSNRSSLVSQDCGSRGPTTPHDSQENY